jgi:O-methyltransferase involved in polyketide biosynthesis
VTITHVSDTARWVAVYRAMESERPDAHFRDLFARPHAWSRGPLGEVAAPLGRTSRDTSHSPGIASVGASLVGSRSFERTRPETTW